MQAIETAFHKYPNGPLDKELLDMCREKYLCGAAEHGEGTWIGTNIPKLIYPEIMDGINYTGMWQLSGIGRTGKGPALNGLIWQFQDTYKYVKQLEKRYD